MSGLDPAELPLGSPDRLTGLAEALLDCIEEEGVDPDDPQAVAMARAIQRFICVRCSAVVTLEVFESIGNAVGCWPPDPAALDSALGSALA